MANEIVTASQSSGNLNFKTVQKMIHRLLTEERIKTPLDEGRVINPALCNVLKVRVAAYTKEELAKKLGITPEELEKLRYPDFYEEMADKISLLLINIYCSTKFADK